MVRITRVKVGKTTKETHRITPIENLYRRYWAQRDNTWVHKKNIHPVIDPFARNCKWGAPFSNDIAIDTEANYHMDALDFLEKMEAEERSFQIGILDPPFSPRQANEAYGGEGANLYASDSPRLRAIEETMARLIVPGGHIIKFGYNSNAPSPALELIEVKILSFGGIVNDWLCSVWTQPNHKLEDFTFVSRWD